MQKVFFLIVGLVIIVGSLFSVIQREVSETHQIQAVRIGGIGIRVDVADDNVERAQGLSGRLALAENEGMFFVFDTPGTYGFWMKEMLFAIDIVWINESKQIVGIEREVRPETFPTVFYPNEAVKYVLELPVGNSQKFGIDTDSQLYFD